MAKPTVTELDQHIGLRLKKLRQQEGLSASALADIIGSTQQQISRYENAQNKISAAQLYTLASHFDVPLAWFFLDVGTEKGAVGIREKSPSYAKNAAVEEEATLQAIWQRLSPTQRNALLKLLDTLTD